MITKKGISNAIALFTTGLLAGTFFYIRCNIVPTYWDVPLDVHLRFRVALMQHNIMLFHTLVAASILSSIWFAWTLREFTKTAIFALFAVFLSIMTFLITYFGNMSINSQIVMWVQSAPPENWRSILSTWEFYHTCRTVTAIMSFVLILIATFFKKLLLKKQSERSW